MDSIRQAIGQRQISYYGFSYGTYLGQVYSTLFPRNVRREILDSNVDPRGVWYQDNFDQDVAFQRNIEIWFGWLAKYNSVYHLGSTESQVARTFSNAQNALARSPAGGEVGPDEWPDIFLEAGYYEQTWEDLGSLFSEWINSPGPASASDLVNAFESTDGVGDDNGYAGYLAVQCSDTAWPSSWPKIVRDNWAVYARAPFETWGNAWFNGPCTNWPGRAGRPVQIDGSRVNSALLIDETLDAATPFPGSLEVRTLFPHASLIAEPGAPATPTRCLVTRASTARSRITSRRALCPHVSASRRGTRHAPRCRNRTRRRRRPPPRCVPRDRRPGPPHLRRLRPLGSPERLAAGSGWLRFCRVELASEVAGRRALVRRPAACAPLSGARGGTIVDFALRACRKLRMALATAREDDGRMSRLRFIRQSALLGAGVALVLPAAAGGGQKPIVSRVRASDHAAYVQVVVDFVGPSIRPSNVEAVDPRPADGKAGLHVSHVQLRPIAAPRSVGGVSVHALRRAGRLLVEMRLVRTRFKYLAYALRSPRRLVIDLWKNAPPSGPATVRRGSRGCLTMGHIAVGPGVVVASGGESGLFEHRLQVVVRGHDGRVLGRQAVVGALDSRWTAQVSYRAMRAQTGTLEAVAFSAKDGALACLVQVRVSLQNTAPAGREADVYVTDTTGNAVSQYDVEVGGLLMPKSPATIAAPGASGGIAVSPNGRSVYVAGSDRVYQYQVGPGGELAPSSNATAPVGVADLALSPDGKSVYVTGSTGLSEYDLDPIGAFVPRTPSSVATGGGARGVVVSPDSKSVYVANESDNSLSEYDVGPGGVLTPKSPATIATITTPLGVAISPDGHSLYAAGAGGVSQFNIDPGGALSPKSPATLATLFVSGITVSPDGKSVYALGPVLSEIYQFDVGPGGALTSKSPATVPAGQDPYSIVVSPAGTNAYATNGGSNTISEYDITSGGVLRSNLAATIPAGGWPVGIAISP